VISVIFSSLACCRAERVPAEPDPRVDDL